ncbi:MAG: hypothetical protein RL701_6777 [Pseudomonadota bacterium]
MHVMSHDRWNTRRPLYLVFTIACACIFSALSSCDNDAPRAASVDRDGGVPSQPDHTGVEASNDTEPSAGMSSTDGTADGAPSNGGSPEDAASGSNETGNGEMANGSAGQPTMPDSRDAGISGNDEDAGVICVPPEKPANFSAAPKCSPALCPAQDSVCLPDTTLDLLIPQSTIDLLARCSATSACVPLKLANEVGRSILTTCTSLNATEGRCVSSCVPQVANQVSILPRDICAENERCAPCFDPRTGEDTKACRQGCDSGPKQAAKPFATCCSNRGLCVPPALTGAQAHNLEKDSCTGENLCAPRDLTDLTFKPKACDSVDGVEGRCMSTCLGGTLKVQRTRLPGVGCGVDELCAPCFDPVTGEDTGACTVNGDAPQKPKHVFTRCCGENIGVCVPPALAGDQGGLLSKDTCEQGKVCAPIEKALDPAYTFPKCDMTAQGACVPQCTLNQFLGGILGQGMCAVGSVCAPCSLFGAATGACD